MKSYRGVITSEVLILIVMLVLFTGRGRLLWLTLLGETQAVQGTAPSGSNTIYGYAFSTLGIIIAAILAIKFGKGAFGLTVAWFLAAFAAAMGLLYYQQVLGVFFTKSTPAPSKTATGG